MNDMLKDLTINVLTRIEKPKGKRYSKRKEKSLAHTWFGLVPFSIKVISNSFKKRFKKIKLSKES